MADFKSLLKRPADSFERPKPLPPGTYNGVIAQREFLESREKKTPYVRFSVKINSPGEGIDPAQLEGVDLSKKSLRKDFFITEDATYRLTEFANSCDVPTAGRGLDEVIEDLVNKPVLVEVTTRPSDRDPQEFFNDIADLKGA